jgi:chromatin remodeling complex protein RSC6
MFDEAPPVAKQGVWTRFRACQGFQSMISPMKTLRFHRSAQYDCDRLGFREHTRHQAFPAQQYPQRTERFKMATAKKAAAPAKKAAAPAKKAAAPAAKKAAAPAAKKAAAPAKKAAAPAAKKAAAPAKKAAAPAKKRAPNAAFMKALTPSAALAAIVGANPLPRTEITKKVWEYIKKNKLQDAVQKRVIIADAKLKEVFGKAKADMFEMTKLISSHLK